MLISIADIFTNSEGQYLYIRTVFKICSVLPFKQPGTNQSHNSEQAVIYIWTGS